MDRERAGERARSALVYDLEMTACYAPMRKALRAPGGPMKTRGGAHRERPVSSDRHPSRHQGTPEKRACVHVQVCTS